MLAPGQNLDRYTVLAELGSGGMATVFKVRHNTLNSLHALKLLKVQSPVIRQRLMQEGRTQASLRHPNIVTVTDVVEVDGASGLVMEFIDGPTLEAWLRDHRPSLADAERLFLGVLAGVARAHRHGLVHRDLKPGNVLLEEGDDGLVPKVTDFGLVKALSDDDAASHTRSGIAMGTPAYMSPEQVRNAKNVDQRTDIFALGCILYELVCGEQAFSGEDTFSVLNAVVTGDYRAPERIVEGIPERVRAAIAGCLKVNRDERIADCAQLRKVLAGEVTLSRPPAASSTMAGEDLDAGQAPAAAAAPVRSETWAHAAGGLEEVGPTPVDDLKAPPPVPASVVRTRLPEAPPTDPPALSGTLAGEWFGGEPDPKPSAPRARTLLIAAAVALVLGVGGIGVVGLGAVAWSTASPRVEPAIAPAVSEAETQPEVATEIVPAEPAAPAPAPKPSVPQRAASETKPAAVSVAEPATAPAPPAPAAPAPTVAARPEPTPAAPEVDDGPPMGTVRVTGDARRVVLQRAGTRLSPGPVSAGVYEIRADFEGNPDVDAGRVTIRAGATVTLECDSAYLMCRPVK
ncbi:MAG: serine/threonine-protein kinase [Myxococcota bacterium]